MKKKLNFIITIFVFGFFLSSCQGAKDAIQGKTRSESSDEFLVQKKNTLSMPPDIDKLPVPLDEIQQNRDNISEDNDLKAKLKIKNETKDSNQTNKSSSLEKKIIDKISE